MGVYVEHPIPSMFDAGRKQSSAPTGVGDVARLGEANSGERKQISVPECKSNFEYVHFNIPTSCSVRARVRVCVTTSRARGLVTSRGGANGLRRGGARPLRIGPKSSYGGLLRPDSQHPRANLARSTPPAPLRPAPPRRQCHPAAAEVSGTLLN